MKQWWLISIAVIALLGGCKDPEQEYYAQIERAGFIPFKQPVGNVRSGSVLRGKPSQLFPMGPPTRCFPDKIGDTPTELRWETDTTLPQTHYSAKLDFNAKLNTISGVGTPSLTFKFDMHQITKVDFEAKNVTVEMIDQFTLQDFFERDMSEKCKEQLMISPFVVNAMQAKEMSYVFLDVFNGNIQLDFDTVQKIVDFEAGVQWHIENGYKLVITTPKFIGYHLAQLREKDRGLVNVVSSEVDEEQDAYLWTHLDE